MSLRPRTRYGDAYGVFQFAVGLFAAFLIGYGVALGCVWAGAADVVAYVAVGAGTLLALALVLDLMRTP